MRTLMRTGLAALGLAALLSSGCAEAEDAQDAPTLEITATPDTIASGDTVTITIDVTDFELVMPHEHGDLDDATQFRSHIPGHLPNANVGAEGKPLHDDYSGPREGMYHVYLDSVESEPLGMGHMETFEVVVEADPGAHELIVRLHGADHKKIDPEISDAAPITVE